MFWTADILFLETHETITCLEEAAVGRAAWKCFSSPFVSKWDNPDCWPEELARLWCCLQWPAANGRKAVWTVLVKSSHTGHWCQHIQEERECYTSHIAERSSASHYTTYSCFVSWGLMWGREVLRETPWPGMGPAAATFEVTVGTRSFIFTEKRKKTQGMDVISKLFC